MKIVFENVGRDKKSWIAETEAVSYAWLMKEIRKHRALASRDIEFDFDSGSIFAGFRRVGAIREQSK